MPRSALAASAKLMVVLGGVGTLTGPLFGAAVLVLVQYFLAGSFDALVPVVLGFTFMAAVLGFRRGIAGVFGKSRNQGGIRGRFGAPIVPQHQGHHGFSFMP